MRLYLSIAQGESAATAESIFATRDQDLIDLVIRALARKTGTALPSPLRPIKRRRGTSGEEGAADE